MRVVVAGPTQTDQVDRHVEPKGPSLASAEYVVGFGPAGPTAVLAAADPAEMVQQVLVDDLHG